MASPVSCIQIDSAVWKKMTVGSLHEFSEIVNSCCCYVRGKNYLNVLQIAIFQQASANRTPKYSPRKYSSYCFWQKLEIVILAKLEVESIFSIAPSKQITNRMMQAQWLFHKGRSFQALSSWIHHVNLLLLRYYNITGLWDLHHLTWLRWSAEL